MIIGIMALGDNKAEKGVLNKLYEDFWDNNLLEYDGDIYSDIHGYLPYLLYKFLKQKRVYRYIKKVKMVIYKENVSKNDELYNQCAFILNRVNVITLGIGCVIFGCTKKYYSIVIHIILAGVVAVILKNSKIKQKNMENIVQIITNTHGYMFVMEKKSKFIGEVSIYRNLFLENYIRKLNNLMMFYYIITSNTKQDQYEIVRRSLVDMLDVLKENENNKTEMEKAMYYLPVFTCGYYIFSNCCESEEDFPKEVIELYRSLKMNKREEKDINKTINSFIYKANKYRTSKKDKHICRDIKRQDESIDYFIETGYGELFKTITN